MANPRFDQNDQNNQNDQGDGDFQSDENQAILSVKNYPELAEAQEGSPISGRFEGRIKTVDGDRRVIEFAKVDIETENGADKELRNITGEKRPVAAASSGDSSSEI